MAITRYPISATTPAGALPPSGVTAAGLYAPRLNLYNATVPSFRRLHAKLGSAQAGAGLCKIACCGDSITAGHGSATRATQAWPVVLSAFLEERGYPSAGSGLVYCTASNTPTDVRWTYGTGWTDFNSGIRTHLKKCSTNGSTATYTSTNAGTVAELQYSNASGPFTVTIDGGSPVTVTPAGGTTLAFYTVTGLADTTHTIVVTVTSAAQVYLVAGQVRQTTGVLVSNAGIGGSVAADWSANADYDPRNAVSAWAPNFVTLSLGANDANNGVVVATYKTQMQTLIGEFSSFADILLVVTSPGQGFDLTPYRQACYELADTNNLPLLDIYDRWGSYSLASALGQMNEGTHPNATGYADMGAAICTAITS